MILERATVRQSILACLLALILPNWHAVSFAFLLVNDVGDESNVRHRVLTGTTMKLWKAIRNSSRSRAARRSVRRGRSLRFESLEPRRVLAAGVTIITHGWQPSFGPQTAPPGWTLEMAREIGARGTDANIYTHNADPNSAGYGGWTPLTNSWSNSGDLGDELILVFDWQWESDDTEEGWMHGAADNLFAGLMEAPVDVLSRPIHFIGHSRGAVLNSLTVAQFGERHPAMTIDHVTSLDPHPILASGLAGSQYEADDPAVLIYENVAYADTYFRRDSTDASSYQDDFDFDGVSVLGAGLNLELDEFLLTEPGYNSLTAREHLDVHLWYMATINTTANTLEGQPITQVMEDTWWLSGQTYASNLEANSGRENVGFARSRIGQLSRAPLAVTDGRPLSEAPIDLPVLFNGDFEFGDAFNNELPGWARHGGLHSGDLTSDRLHLGESGLANYVQATHNPFFIPENAKFLQFEYEVTDTSTDDVLEVRIGQTQLATISLENAGSSITKPIWVGDFADSVNTLDLQLNAGLLIGSDVHIDNVAIATSDHDWQNPIDFFDVNANGNVNVQDGFLVINELRSRGVNVPLPDGGPGGGGPFVDTNGNDRIDLPDAFSVIAQVRANQGSRGGEGEAASGWIEQRFQYAPASRRSIARDVQHSTEPESLILPITAKTSYDMARHDADAIDAVWAEHDTYWDEHVFIDKSVNDASSVN